MSVRPKRIVRTGLARSSSTTMAAIAAIAGWRMTPRTRRLQKPLSSGRSRPKYGSLPAFTRAPRIDQRGGQERQAADDRHEDHRDRAERHRVEQLVRQDVERRDRDHHGEAAEEDRAAGRAAGDLDGALRVRAAPPLRPEARDHEQRVVDGHRQPDEHDQLRRVRADRVEQLAVDARAGRRRRAAP